VASDNSMCPGSNQPLKNEYQDTPDNLPLSSADVTETGSLNLPEPSGPHRPVMGLLYLYFSTPLFRINWDGETSRCAENPDNWIFLWKYVTSVV
jgi:hypothetical protein